MSTFKSPLAQGGRQEYKIFFILGPRKDKSRIRIQSWEFRIKMETSVGTKTVLPRLPSPILRTYTPLPIQISWRMSSLLSRP